VTFYPVRKRRGGLTELEKKELILIAEYQNYLEVEYEKQIQRQNEFL